MLLACDTVEANGNKLCSIDERFWVLEGLKVT